MPKPHSIEHLAPERTRAVIVAIQLPDRDDDAVNASIAELSRLMKDLAIDVVHVVVQRRPTPGSLGKGRLDELAGIIGAKVPDDGDSEDHAEEERTPTADMVVFDGELPPGDARHMQRALGVPVIDRCQIILRVFEERAQTREAQLEIELAQLTYEAPRIRDNEKSHGRVGGGGRGGKGHTGVELTKQRMRERSAQLREQLEEVHRAHTSRQARRSDTFRVALVGYTNAGKSSLMRALTGSEVLVEDKLFATLGTTVRALQPETTPRILVSDTVGFIRNLPHSLIASFRATLAEAHEADLLLIVADASDPELPAELEVTRNVLDELDAGNIPSRLVLNKVDRLDPQLRDKLEARYPDAIFTSAHDASRVAELHRTLKTFFDDRLLRVSLLLPYGELALLSQIRTEARIDTETYEDAGVALTLLATDVGIGRLERLLEPRHIDLSATATLPTPDAPLRIPAPDSSGPNLET